jgi:hypothetical protein
LNAINRATRFIERDTVRLYFPLKESGQDSVTNANSLDTFMNVWYSKILFALHEPILYNYGGEGEIYRFTWLRTFHNPITVRAERLNNNIKLTAKVSSGAGGYEPGKISINKTILIDENKWNEIKAKFSDLNFWTLPVESDFRGTDGSEWILESSTKDKYHFATRWSPEQNGAYGKCCLFLLKLSGIDVPKKDWY